MHLFRRAIYIFSNIGGRNSKTCNIMKADIDIMPQTTLQLYIKNTKPVELLVFTETLRSISSQFKAFVEEEGETEDIKNATLYVKQVQPGSILVELYEFASVGLIPFALAHSDIIVAFANYLKLAFDFFETGKGEKPLFSVADCKDFYNSCEIFEEDKGLTISVNTVNSKDGNVTNYFVINSERAEQIKGGISRELASLTEKTDSVDVYENQYMTLYQARDSKSKFGNKAQIDALNKKPMNLMFDTDELRYKIIDAESNPLKTAYSVDVVIVTAGGIPSAYKVVKLRESYPME